MRSTVATLAFLALAAPAWAQVMPSSNLPGAAAPGPAGGAAGSSMSASSPPAAVSTPGANGVPAMFELRTTRDLVSLCNTPESDPNYPGAIGVCVGFGTGVLDYHLLDTSSRNNRARRVCLPTPAPSRGDARRAFIAWGNANDRYMDEPAAEGVMRFLIATYPCKR